MDKIERTQYFDAASQYPEHPGRYLYKEAGAKRPVMRWWNGDSWQLNRRKAIYVAVVRGDQWAGAATKHPEVALMLESGLSGKRVQPIKLNLDRRTSERRTTQRRGTQASMAA